MDCICRLNASGPVVRRTDNQNYSRFVDSILGRHFGDTQTISLLLLIYMARVLSKYRYKYYQALK